MIVKKYTVIIFLLLILFLTVYAIWFFAQNNLNAFIGLISMVIGMILIGVSINQSIDKNK